MPFQSINLGALGAFTLWTGAKLVDSGLIAAGGVGYLRQFGLGVGDRFFLRLADTVGGVATNAGPRLISAIENGRFSILLEEVGGSFFFIPGPNYSGNMAQDTSEPYEWNIGASEHIALEAWLNGIGTGEVIITLDTGEIALSDFLSDGLVLEVGARLVASGSSSGNDALYRDADRGGTDAPTEGELGLGPNESIISMIEKTFGNTAIRLRDNDNPVFFAFNVYFAVTGGRGRDLTIYIQTSSGVTSIPLEDNITSFGGGWFNANVPANQRRAFSQIVAGRPFLFILARQDTSVFNVDATFLAKAGIPSFALTPSVVTYFDQDAAFRASAGMPTMIITAQSVGDKDITFLARAGNPSFIIKPIAHVVVAKDGVLLAKAGSPSFVMTGDAMAVVNKNATLLARSGSPLFVIGAESSGVINKDAIFLVRAGSPSIIITPVKIFALGAEETLFSSQYVTPMEIGMDNIERGRMGALVPPLLTDIKNTDESLLPFISYGLGIEGNIAFLPPNVRNDIIEHVEYYITYRGTRAVLRQAALDLEITLVVNITDNQAGGRDIELRTSPPSYAIGDNNWAVFVRTFLEYLLPWTLNLTGVIIENIFNTEIYLHGMISPYNLSPNFGGTVRNA